MAGPRIRTVPRERDVQVLDWLKLKCAGRSWAYIARRSTKGPPAHVQIACTAVRSADLAESGEDPDKVRGGYWP